LISTLYRTLVWAIDLDDGTLINALGSNMARPKALVYNGSYVMADVGVYAPPDL
jgi:chitinase